MPYAISMWDFSWLTRRSGECSEYADFDKVLDELVDRGYDAIRIDCSPHLIGPDRDGTTLAETVVFPTDPLIMWGHVEPVRVRPADDLVDLVRKAAARDVTIGLSAWYCDDTTHRKLRIETAEDLTRVWSGTLELLERHDLLGSVQYVDLCNEFATRSWSGNTYPQLFPGSDRPRRHAWTPEERARVNAMFAAIDPLRERWPDLPYTFSLIPYPAFADDVLALDVSRLDLLEIHIWLSMASPDYDAATFASETLDDVPGLQRHVDAVWDVYWNDRARWIDDFDRIMTRYATWARANGKSLVTTEGWASIQWDTRPTPDGRDSWDYMRDFASAAVDRALALGWDGICTSNFSQPHFPDFWNDVAWHQSVTRRIHEHGISEN